MADSPETPPKDGSGKQKPGWIGDLARRSSGLPEDVTPMGRRTSGDPSLWRIASVGMQFAVTTAILAFGGYKLDEWMGWSPWGLISLTLLAAIGGLYLLIKETSGEDRPRK